MGSRILLCLALAAAVGAGAARLAAYESDQYSNRGVPTADAADELNRMVNADLEHVAARYRRPPAPGRLARRVYRRLGGRHWVDKIERAAMRSDRIERLPQRRWRSIYGQAPLCATRVGFVFGVGRTLRLAGSLVGSDKLGHFFSQGYKYFRRYVRGGSAQETVRKGAFAERWLFGQWTTGVFSNADLVANYEGFLFYRGLLEDGVVTGKPALFAWRDGRLVQQRPFDWADHVNDYWDEALNPSWLSPPLQRYMARTLDSLCDDYRSAPHLFVSGNEDELRQRYRELGLKPAPHNRIDRICTPTGERP